MALNPNEQNGIGSKPLAVKKLVRGPDGRMHVVHIDARTGKEISDLSQYRITSAADQGISGDPLFGNSQNNQTPKEEETTAKEIVRETVKESPDLPDHMKDGSDFMKNAGTNNFKDRKSVV